MEFKHRHLLGIEPLSRDDLHIILNLADSFKEISRRRIKKVPTLRGRTVVNLFMEPSTRTRVSFEIAQKRLSADSTNISVAASSVVKGETLLDTATNLEAMNPDIIVIRHKAAGSPHFLAREVNASIVNAGDGFHEHPTQALLDCLTIKDHKSDFEGLKVAIVGDIAHSRVAHSNIMALSKLGSEVRVAGPATMLQPGLEELGAKVFTDVESAIEGVDVVMALRIQQERLGGDSLFANTREYARKYGLNRERIELIHPEGLVMHPGPINRGVEITPDVADGKRSVILEQVANGVAIRMAVLYLMAGGSPDDIANQK